MPAFVYRNNSRKLRPGNKYLKVALQGEGMNRFGTGSRVTVYYNHTLSYQEQMPARGFESSVDNRLNFGLGGTRLVDSVLVEWPDGKAKAAESGAAEPNNNGKAKRICPPSKNEGSSSAENHICAKRRGLRHRL
jgi:hypothetical protein